MAIVMMADPELGDVRESSAVHHTSEDSKADSCFRLRAVIYFQGHILQRTLRLMSKFGNGAFICLGFVCIVLGYRGSLLLVCVTIPILLLISNYANELFHAGLTQT